MQASHRPKAPRLVVASRDGEEPGSHERKAHRHRLEWEGEAQQPGRRDGWLHVLGDLQRHSHGQAWIMQKGFLRQQSTTTARTIIRSSESARTGAETQNAQLRGKSWAPQRV